MKYIFDFDDVLFNTTKQLKEHIFKCLTDAGIPEGKAREEYLIIRERPEISIRNLISNLFSRYNIKTDQNILYEKIMTECPKFINTKVIEEVKKLGKENCYIITNGEQEFNQDKIKYSGISDLFKKIYIVSGTKNEIIYNICAKNKEDKVIFIDDKIKFIEDIDLTKYPNLKTILYDENGLEKLKAEIE